jgi:hypothetical protein
MYELNPKDFKDLDEEDVKEKGLNTTSPNESENEVNKEYNNCTLVIEGGVFSEIARRGKYDLKRVS